ncbi:diacylglycerol/lipid kinase family protein [Corynebacterium uropygiale]|nr:diacylglycerol kinase family protein [Corynebacterium uropygiale]
MIANPNSTTHTDALFHRIVPGLREVSGLRLRTCFTHRPGHAEDLCRGLRRSDYDVILIVGGDGTVNEAINGLLGPVRADDDLRAREQSPLPALAIIPTGSANVFARAVGIPSDPVAAAKDLAVLLAGNRRRRVCLGTWNDRWFAVNAGFGVDAEVIARIERARARGFAATPLRYLIVSLRAWASAQRQPPAMSARVVDRAGETHRIPRVPLCLVSNTNPWTFLGPVPVVTNPRNSFDNGLSLFALRSVRGVRGVAAMLHLVGVGHRPRWEEWISDRIVSVDDAREITLACAGPQRFQVDGEYEGEYEQVRLRAVPGAIEVVAREHTPAPGPRRWRSILRSVVCAR